MEERKENKMGVMPINKLLVTMSFPLMVSMLIQALYNIVDSMFVARISDNALTAVSLALPIQTLMIAISVGTGVGVNSLLSRRLGQHRYDEANNVAEHAMFLAVLNWIVFAVFGLFFSRPFMNLFTDNPEIAQLGVEYISVCTVFSIGVFVQIAAERIMQATGNTVYHMFVQGTGAILNTILDPILIFGLFGFPVLGVKGAAIATVIAQIVSMCIGIWLNHVKNQDIHIKYRGFRPNFKVIKEIYHVGIPSMIVQSLMSVLLVFLNKILIGFSDVAVSVLSVYFKLQNFVFMPVFGLTNGLIPIVAYNFGAKNKERVVKVIKLAVLYAVLIMIAGTILFECIPDKLLSIFNASDEMYKIGIPALRIVSSSFIFAGVAIVLSCVFQALRLAQISMVVSFVRQIVVVLPAAYILGKFFGLTALWISFPLAEIIGTIITLAFFKKVYKEKIEFIDISSNV